MPRSLATALAPLLAGALLEGGWLGWPLLLGGFAKLVYDFLLLAQFRRSRAGGDARLTASGSATQSRSRRRSYAKHSAIVAWIACAAARGSSASRIGRPTTM